jgi:hypothetical protein
VYLSPMQLYPTSENIPYLLAVVCIVTELYCAAALLFPVVCVYREGRGRDTRVSVVKESDSKRFGISRGTGAFLCSQKCLSPHGHASFVRCKLSPRHAHPRREVAAGEGVEVRGDDGKTSARGQ